MATSLPPIISQQISFYYISVDQSFDVDESETPWQFIGAKGRYDLTDPDEPWTCFIFLKPVEEWHPALELPLVTDEEPEYLLEVEGYPTRWIPQSVLEEILARDGCKNK